MVPQPQRSGLAGPIATRHLPRAVNGDGIQVQRGVDDPIPPIFSTGHSGIRPSIPHCNRERSDSGFGLRGLTVSGMMASTGLHWSLRKEIVSAADLLTGLEPSEVPEWPDEHLIGGRFKAFVVGLSGCSDYLLEARCLVQWVCVWSGGLTYRDGRGHPTSSLPLL